MANLASALANVPGLGGYLAQNEISQNAGMGQLQKVATLSQLQQQMAANQEREQMRQILAQHGGDIEATTKALLAAGRPEAAAKLAPLLEAQRKAKLPQPGQSIGSGGLMMPDGRIVPPAARPNADKGVWSEPYNLNGVTVQKNSVTNEIRTAASRPPNVTVTNEPPVTPVTIQDPNDPRGTIIIDGRSRRVLGKGPRMTEAGKIDAKADVAMSGLNADLQTAEDLLTGVVRTSDGQVVKGNLPTGSVAGSLWDKAGAIVGASPSGAAEADQLKTVAARLIAKVPRFEGPQSDKDVTLYKQAAGDAGNDSLPRARRLAAIKTMREIYKGYETGERGRITGGRRANDVGGAPTGDAPAGVDPKVWGAMTPQEKALWK